jgi:hypothetical protein
MRRDLAASSCSLVFHLCHFCGRGLTIIAMPHGPTLAKICEECGTPNEKKDPLRLLRADLLYD